MAEAYGQRLGERFQVENAPANVTRALRKGEIAVTELRCDNPLPGMSGSRPQEDAFAVSLHLRDFPNREYWEDGRRASVCDVRAGESCLQDLKRDPSTLLDKPYHVLAFYLPRAALDAIADEASALRIRDLSYKPGVGVNDVTISALGGLLLPALSHPDQTNPLFVDHVAIRAAEKFRALALRHGARVRRATPNTRWAGQQRSKSFHG
jgi:AraC family transcriptional regulator